MKPRTWTIWTDAKGGKSSLWRQRGVPHPHQVVEVAGLEALFVSAFDDAVDEHRLEGHRPIIAEVVARLSGEDA